MNRIRDSARLLAQSLGIDVVDVRLKQTNLPEQNLDATFARMRAEREREAEDERARGREAAQRVRALADRTVTETLSEAERDAQITRGEADAQANRIFAEAYGADPEFFDFYRSMQAYVRRRSRENSTMVLTPNSPSSTTCSMATRSRSAARRMVLPHPQALPLRPEPHQPRTPPPTPRRPPPPRSWFLRPSPSPSLSRIPCPTARRPSEADDVAAPAADLPATRSGVRCLRRRRAGRSGRGRAAHRRGRRLGVGSDEPLGWQPRSSASASCWWSRGCSTPWRPGWWTNFLRCSGRCRPRPDASSA